jgi:hypothetical protein
MPLKNLITNQKYLNVAQASHWEFADDTIAVGQVNNPISMPYAVPIFADVFGSIAVGTSALAVHLVVLPFSDVLESFDSCPRAVAMNSAVLVPTDVLGS